MYTYQKKENLQFPVYKREHSLLTIPTIPSRTSSFRLFDLMLSIKLRRVSLMASSGSFKGVILPPEISLVRPTQRLAPPSTEPTSAAAAARPAILGRIKDVEPSAAVRVARHALVLSNAAIPRPATPTVRTAGAQDPMVDAVYLASLATVQDVSLGLNRPSLKLLINLQVFRPLLRPL